MLKKMPLSSDKKPLSFGFSKKIEKQSVIEKSAIAEKHVEAKEETDFVVELEGKEVKRFEVQNFAPFKIKHFKLT